MSNNATAILQWIGKGIIGGAALVLLGVLTWMVSTIANLEKWRFAEDKAAVLREAANWTLVQQSEFADKIDSRLDPIETNVAVIRAMMEADHNP